MNRSNRLAYPLQVCATFLVLVVLPGQTEAVLCGVEFNCNWNLPNVAHYKFDDLSPGGNATNSVPGGPDAIWQGTGANDLNVPVAGLLNGGSQTNDENGGTNEHYRIPDLPALNGASGLTLSVWFNQNLGINDNSVRTGLITSRSVKSSWGGHGLWTLQLNGNGNVKGFDSRIANRQDGGTLLPGDLLPDGNTQFAGVATEDAWHHAVTTWDGTTGQHKTYLDGELINQAIVADNVGTILSSTDYSGGGPSGWYIGDDPCCHGREFTGTLDEVGIWDEALTDQEIDEIYIAGIWGINLAKEPQLPPYEPEVTYEILAANFFTQHGASRAMGDLNGDGAVEWTDFRIFKDNQPLLASNADAVPEPTALAIAALAVLVLCVLSPPATGRARTP